MIKTSIEKLARGIGYDIGASDDCTQADLLNGFCEGLYNSMNDNHKRDMQICYLTDKLEAKSSIVLHSIVEFLKTREENNGK